MKAENFKGGKTKIVTPPKVKDTAPEVHKCYDCKDPILDKAPCGLKDVDGVKKVVCKKCEKKAKESQSSETE